MNQPKSMKSSWAAVEADIRTFTVGTSAVKVLDADPMRIGLLLQSSGSGNITLSTNPKVTAGDGIYLGAGSRPVSINDDIIPRLSGQLLYAVASAAGSTLMVAYARLIA